MMPHRPIKSRFVAYGFTLMELLIVLAIIGLLAGILYPQIKDRFEQGKIRAAKLQMQEIGNALELFRSDVKRYPTTAEGLRALSQAPSGMANWTGPYMKAGTEAKDPWGNDYRYTSPAASAPYELISLGADGRDGGEGFNRDIKGSDQ